jgi:hypothetical protein
LEPKPVLLTQVLLWLKSQQRRQFSKFSVGGLMLVLWIVTCALAASPQLHRLLHKDALGPNHYCLFTQISQHSLAASSGYVIAAEPEHSANTGVRLNELELLPSFDFVLSDSRAPPSNVSSTAVVG